MEIIDISPEISANIAVWPGDKSFERDVVLDFKKGDNLVLSSLTSTLHLGAHADAPNHYHPDGGGISERPLDRYIGECQVIHVDVDMGHRIGPEHIRDKTINAKRVLLATGSFPNPDHWNENFCSLSPELVESLATAGVVTLGIDTPSIDPFSSKDLEAHNAVYKHDMAVLEGLLLSHVTPGLYQLVALPLKIKDADASPVRAVLIKN